MKGHCVSLWDQTGRFIHGVLLRPRTPTSEYLHTVRRIKDAPPQIGAGRAATETTGTAAQALMKPVASIRGPLTRTKTSSSICSQLPTALDTFDTITHSL